jgi:hypothetical protein
VNTVPIPTLLRRIPPRHRTAVSAARIALGILFIVAALLKWFAPAHGATLYGGLPAGVINLPVVIIVAEILLGLWLVSGLAGGWAGIISALTLAFFTGAIVFDMFQPHPTPCGCMGAAYVSAHSPAAVECGLALGIVQNLVLASIASVVWLSSGGIDGVKPAATSQGAG